MGDSYLHSSSGLYMVMLILVPSSIQCLEKVLSALDILSLRLQVCSLKIMNHEIMSFIIMLTAGASLTHSPEFIVTPPSQQTVVAGDTVTLECFTSGRLANQIIIEVVFLNQPSL